MKKIFLPMLCLLILGGAGCQQPAREAGIAGAGEYPKIASWLAKKDQIIGSGKPYDLVMSGWFEPGEAEAIKNNNTDALLLAGLTANWVWSNQDWLTFLTTAGNYGLEEPVAITEDMYLHQADGSRCDFGWASDLWNQEEIYSMDPRNPDWARLVVNFYKNALSQPRHDGIIVDMVTEKSWCPEAISDQEWLEATKNIFQQIKALNKSNKLVIFNSGKDFSEIDEYAEYFDGYVMENFLGSWGADFQAGLDAAAGDYLVVYAVDTENTGNIDEKKMRLGLTLSLLNDKTYFTYDVGPRDHGQAWWFDEYSVDLGRSQGDYYQKDGAYWRDFEKGIVVSNPFEDAQIEFQRQMIDATSGLESDNFKIDANDGRIYKYPQ